MTHSPNQIPEEQEPRVVVRDKRRVDPVTGALREPAAAPAPERPASQAPQPGGPAAADERVATLESTLAERTADLQRVTAEYANYRKRVDRDRLATQEQALANVLLHLLPVLDDIGRARAHGELEGGFRSVGESVENTLGKLGLVRFGEPGDPFDPTVHEAMTHRVSPDVTELTCVEVFSPGYRLGERLLRPARVAVAEPEADEGLGAVGE